MASCAVEHLGYFDAIVHSGVRLSARPPTPVWVGAFRLTSRSELDRCVLRHPHPSAGPPHRLRGAIDPKNGGTPGGAMVAHPASLASMTGLMSVLVMGPVLQRAGLAS
jgi:hypothetical protein